MSSSSDPLGKSRCSYERIRQQTYAYGASEVALKAQQWRLSVTQATKRASCAVLRRCAATLWVAARPILPLALSSAPLFCVYRASEVALKAQQWRLSVTQATKRASCAVLRRCAATYKVAARPILPLSNSSGSLFCVYGASGVAFNARSWRLSIKQAVECFSCAVLSQRAATYKVAARPILPLSNSSGSLFCVYGASEVALNVHQGIKQAVECASCGVLSQRAATHRVAARPILPLALSSYV